MEELEYWKDLSARYNNMPIENLQKQFDGWSQSYQEMLQETECPKCQSKKVTFILFGLPIDWFYDWIKRESKKMGFTVYQCGGCISSDDNKSRICTECNNSW